MVRFAKPAVRDKPAVWFEQDWQSLGKKNFAVNSSHPLNPVNSVYGFLSASGLGFADTSSFGAISYSGLGTPINQ